MFTLLDNWPTVFAATGRKPGRIGNRHLATAPYDCYRARDGWVVIAVASNKLFRALAAAIGRPELGEDPRFRGSRGRLERSEEVNSMVAEWVAERSVDEVLSVLGPEGARIPCSPVYTPDQLLAHPQLLAREMIRRLPHPVAGEVVVPGVAVKLSETPGDVRRLGPELGEHNREIYEDLVGLEAEEIGRLRAAGVI